MFNIKPLNKRLIYKYIVHINAYNTNWKTKLKKIIIRRDLITFQKFLITIQISRLRKLFFVVRFTNYISLKIIFWNYISQYIVWNKIKL